MKNELVLPEFESIEELDDYLVLLLEVDHNARRFHESGNRAVTQLTETRPFVEALGAGDKPRERNTSVKTLAEKIEERDRQLAEIERCLDPRYADLTRAEGQRLADEAYQRRIAAEPTERQIAEAALTGGRESDAAFDRRRREEADQPKKYTGCVVLA